MSQKQDPTPRIQVELDSLLGGKRIETVRVDSNRIDPVSEAGDRWLNDLAIPARFADQILQMLCWVSGSAFWASLMGSIPITFWPAIGVLVMVPVAAALYGFIRFPEVRLFVLYRIALILIGLYLGCNL